MYEVQKVHILPLYLLVKAYQQLSLFAHYDAYNSLNVFTIPPKPAPSGCCYRVGNLVPTASHPGITPHACVGRLHLMEQAVNSNHNTLVNNYIKRHRVAHRLAHNGSLSNNLFINKNLIFKILIFNILQKTNQHKIRLLDSLTARQ
jgi:hypothetical protein